MDSSFNDLGNSHRESFAPWYHCSDKSERVMDKVECESCKGFLYADNNMSVSGTCESVQYSESTTVDGAISSSFELENIPLGDVSFFTNSDIDTSFTESCPTHGEFEDGFPTAMETTSGLSITVANNYFSDGMEVVYSATTPTYATQFADAFAASYRRTMDSFGARFGLKATSSSDRSSPISTPASSPVTIPDPQEEPNPSNGRKPRHDLSRAEKRQLYEFYLAHPGVTHANIAKDYDLSRTAVGNIIARERKAAETAETDMSATLGTTDATTTESQAAGFEQRRTRKRRISVDDEHKAIAEDMVNHDSNCTHQQIADRLGAHRTTISKRLKEWGLLRQRSRRRH
ncbi:uncharacterized protein V1518DRAFT_405482 [Limtongia smithiae]|uniref:uncharacterized protein n=1 Tax=Limtongia smithiae TaxID=1125753 RepID=UPI0034CE6C38